MAWNTIHPKAGMAGLGGSVAVIIVWIITSATNVQVPPDVAAAIAGLSSFLASYLTGVDTGNGNGNGTVPTAPAPPAAVIQPKP